MSNAMATIAAMPAILAPEVDDDEEGDIVVRNEAHVRRQGTGASTGMMFVLGNPAPPPSMDEIQREFSHADDNNSTVNSQTTQNLLTRRENSDGRGESIEEIFDQLLSSRRLDDQPSSPTARGEEGRSANNNNEEKLYPSLDMVEEEGRSANNNNEEKLYPSLDMVEALDTTTNHTIPASSQDENYQHESSYNSLAAAAAVDHIVSAQPFVEETTATGSVAVATSATAGTSGSFVMVDSLSNSNSMLDNNAVENNDNGNVDFIQDAVFAHEATGTATVAAMAAPSADVVDPPPPMAEWTEELDEKMAACLGGTAITETLDNVADVIDIADRNHPADELLAMQLQNHPSSANELFLQQQALMTTTQNDESNAVRAEFVGRDYAAVSDTFVQSSSSSSSLQNAGDTAAAVAVSISGPDHNIADTAAISTSPRGHRRHTTPDAVASSSSSTTATGVAASTISASSPMVSPVVSVATVETIPSPFAASASVSTTATAAAATLMSLPCGDGDGGEEQATIVEIEEDVHPFDIVENEVQATLTGTIPNSSTRIGEGEEREHATIVDIEEDVHPSDIVENEVQATFTGTIPSPSPRSGSTTSPAMATIPVPPLTPSSDQKATIVAIAENNVHPISILQDEATATSIRRDHHARSQSASSPPVNGRPLPMSSIRSVSEPATPTATAFTNTFEEFPNEFTPNTTRDERTWVNMPTAVSPAASGNPNMSMPIILPPPVLEGVEGVSGTAGSSTAEVRDGSASSQEHSSSQEQRPSLPHRSMSTPRVESNGTTISEATNSSNGSRRQSLHCSLSTYALRSTEKVMEKLFGEVKPGSRPRRGSGDDRRNAAAASILPRTQLPASVFRNQTTKTWVATINTNQKALDSNNIEEASKALKAYSVPTRLQAEEIARSMAPPRMLPFNDNPNCFICESRFAVFKRACHCRNCGVCICAGCAVSWSSKMIPETFNIKGESTVNICKSCDWLCSAFRTALLNGEHDEAVALHATGNVNLITPFANVKGELFYPVHCAVLGGRLSLLKWLVDDHFCPVEYTRTNGSRSSRCYGGSTVPILTSKGRSVLGIAMTEHFVDVVRYLVVSKGLSLHDEKGITITTALLTLDAALRKLPAEEGETPSESPTAAGGSYYFPAYAAGNDESQALASLIQKIDEEATPAPSDDNNKETARDDVSLLGDDACIICYSNQIDCVGTPCGHQICCIECSTNISTCPVCTKPCTFIRVYKP